MVHVEAKRAGRWAAAGIIGGAALALTLAATPASAQYGYPGYGPPGYGPPGYGSPAYYPRYPSFPPSWYYSPFDNPYGYTLVNPEYPCVWEGRGCPTGR